LRRQYLKRNPEANPIVSDLSPALAVRTSAYVPPQQSSEAVSERKEDNKHDPVEHSSENPPPFPPIFSGSDTEDAQLLDTLEAPSDQVLVADHAAINDSLKDWRDLPMLLKLDSMHFLTEWQFHNPQRLRSLMKDDDETAQWVSLFLSSRFLFYPVSNGG
jgi:hypothetical protein